MGEETVGKLFLFAEWAFHPSMFHFVRVLLSICTLNWRLNTYVSRQGKDVNRKKGSTKGKK